MAGSNVGRPVPAVLGAEAGSQMAVSFIGLIVLIFVVALAVAFVVVVVRVFSPRDDAPHRGTHMPHRHRSGAGPVVALLLAGVVLLGLLVVGSWVTVAKVEVAQPATATDVVGETQVAVVRSERIEAVPEGGEWETEGVPEDGMWETEDGTVRIAAVTEDGGSAVPSLPEWTSIPEKTLAAGQVPTVRRVVQSGLYATQDEASRAAMRLVQSELRTRLSASYPQFASWTIPLKTIETHCVKQKYVGVRQTQFGEVSEPMYQVWLQYEDSPHVRDPIIAEWERSAVDGRSKLYIAGAGLLALLLGTVSAGTRMLIAPKGSKGRAAFATVALGLGTGLAAFTLFVA